MVLARYDKKSLETLFLIKKYLIEVMINIGCGDQVSNDKQMNVIYEETITKYLGILEKKSIEVISEYSKLIAE